MNIQHEFLRQTALFNAIGAAFQRASIYSDAVIFGARDAIKNDLEDRLRRLEPQYTRAVTSQRHCRNIDRLAKALSNKHAQALKDGLFRTGVAQKALNIYLKLIWCYGWIPEPPHCPLDSVVLAAAGDTQTKWTKMPDIASYRTAIEGVRCHVREHAPGKSLSQWELEAWVSRRRGRVLKATLRQPE